MWDSIQRKEKQFALCQRVKKCLFLSLIIFGIKIFLENYITNIDYKFYGSILSVHSSKSVHKNDNISLDLNKGSGTVSADLPSNKRLMRTKDNGRSTSHKLNTTFQEEILNQADQNIIIISTTDYYYMDLALNLHHSFKMFNITNYVFACSHHKACEELASRNIQ